MSEAAGPAGSGLRQVRVEPDERALPRVLGRWLMVRPARVAVESVLSVGIAHDVRIDGCRLRRLSHHLHLVAGDRLVLIAEQPEPWGLQLRCELGGGCQAEAACHDAAAIERGRTTQGVANSGEDDDAPTHAEPDDTDP